MRILLAALSVLCFVGALGLAVVFALGHSPSFLLRLIACVVVMDHAALTLFHLFAVVRIAVFAALLRFTSPLTVAISLAAIVSSARSGHVPIDTVAAVFATVVLVLGALTQVYLVREAREET